MQSISLFEGDDFTLLEEERLEQVAVEGDLFEEFVAEAVAVEEAPAVDAGPRYSEREDLAARATVPCSVFVHKVANKAVSVSPCDLAAAIILMQFKSEDRSRKGISRVRPDLPERLQAEELWADIPDIVEMAWQENEESLAKTGAYPAKAYFAMRDALAPEFAQSKVYRFLRSIGLNPVAAPSLVNWIPREYARRERDNTPFLLPEIIDSRPLYERLEEGTILRCTAQNGRFARGTEYIVGQKTASNEETGEDGFVMLHQYDSGRRRAYSYALRWNEPDEMEPYFQAVQEQVTIYDPPLCVPEKYKARFEANRKRIEKEKWPLFDHTVFDVSQAAVKPQYFNGKPMRMGKAQPLDAKILTPSGWRRMGDLMVGDHVFGSNGKPVEVEAIYPQGPKEVFRVEFRDGSATECCREHLWEVNLPWRKYEGRDGRVVALGEIKDELFDGAGNAKFFIPIVQPIEFPERDLPLDPYALGALLGDGRLSVGQNGYGTPSFTSEDPELVEAVESALPEGMKAVPRDAISYELVTPGGQGGHNPLIQILERLDLRHRAEGKFIPEIYKFSSVDQRRRLLSGLLDTDGGGWKQTSEKAGTVVEITSVSERLIDDVLFVVQSLGGVATKSSRIPEYTHKGERRQGQRAYRLRIKLAPGWNPFTLKRKADDYKPCMKFQPARAMVSVTSVGVKPCQCITVGSKDGLYVTDDCILTHNTRESIVWHRLRGNKRTAFICPKNIGGFVIRELKALGIDDYQVVDNHKILNRTEKQPWMEIIPYGWMKYKRDPFDGSLANQFPVTQACPHCGVNLERRALVEETDVNGNVLRGNWIWTPDYGYMCRNPECRVRREPVTCAGALWGPIGPQPSRTVTKPWKGTVAIEGGRQSRTASGRTGSGYVDLARKEHARHIFSPTGKLLEGFFHGRGCTKCGYVDKTWVPAPYRRLKHRYDGITMDEIHQIKTGSSDITLAALSLHAKEFNGLTGTLMPNDPSDAYWPLFRMFGNGTHRFPYEKTRQAPYKGVTEFNADFTDTLTVENRERETSYKKKIPYLKNPVKFWQLMAPKMIRRTYDDPLVVQSLDKAGLKVPKSDRRVLVVPPDPKQAALILASMQEFDQQWRDYRTQLTSRGIDSGRTQLINTAYVVSQMTRMRLGATCPDYINVKLGEQGLPPMYLGAKGGGKMQRVYDICLNKCSKGEKVLILSDFRVMQNLMAEELALFKPILFNTSWNKDKRQEAFDLFNEDPDYKVFIAGPKAIGLGVDLAGGPDSLCRTVISTDLLWRPGEQLQAWARIMKPAKEEYTVEVYILVLDATIDQHVYNVFYSKLFAAEQALDRKVVTKKDKAFDVSAFVDQVLSDRDRMLAFMTAAGEDELAYMPYVEMFQMEDREA
jgi:hypothetical protein